MAADRKPYHRTCVKCFPCNIPLNPRTLNEHQEQLYCNVCYERIFNPAEFTVDYYSGIITPEDIERSNFIILGWASCAYVISPLHMFTAGKRRRRDWKRSAWRGHCLRRGAQSARTRFIPRYGTNYFCLRKHYLYPRFFREPSLYLK